jgi:hypothetical protein
MASKNLVIAALLLLSAGSGAAYIVDGSRVNQPRLLSYAKEALQNQGVLQQNSDGFTYVHVPDQYIQDLLHKVARPGFGIPQFSQNNAISNAYITVMTADETKNIKELREIGQTIHFKPLGFYTVVIHDKEYFMLAVDAPSLSEIREKYGLSAKPENHAFNLTVGVRRLTSENELATPEEVASLHP